MCPRPLCFGSRFWVFFPSPVRVCCGHRTAARFLICAARPPLYDSVERGEGASDFSVRRCLCFPFGLNPNFIPLSAAPVVLGMGDRTNTATKQAGMDRTHRGRRQAKKQIIHHPHPSIRVSACALNPKLASFLAKPRPKDGASCPGAKRQRNGRDSFV